MKKKAVIQYIVIIACIGVLVGFQGFFYEISEFSEILLTYLPRVTVALLVILSAKVILGASKPFMQRVLETSIKFPFEQGEVVTGRSTEEIRNILKLWDYLVWIIAVLLILSIMVQDIGAFLISFGLIGFGLTFAMQTPITCFVGWLIILIRRPFKIDDRIIVMGIEGEVVDITIIYTLVREIDMDVEGEPTGRLITVPNSVLLEKPIINYSFDVPYLWDEVHTAITYESDYEKAEKLILSAAKEVLEEELGKEIQKGIKVLSKALEDTPRRGWVAKEPEIRRVMRSCEIEIAVRYVTPIRGRRKIRTEITRRILDKIKETDGVERSYPHMDVLVPRK